MDKLRALQYFVAAAQEGSFAAAARRLDVSVPAVQKLVTSLERHLGVTLFERNVHGSTLTGSGDTYLSACQPVLADLAAADEAVSRSLQRPTGTLVVAMHAQLAHNVILPALPRFHALYPEIQFDLRIINRMSDADADNADVFLLHGWPEVKDMVHRRLGMAKTVIVAAPAYWAANPMPRHPSELREHVCLLMRTPSGTLIDLWEFDRGGEKASVTVSGWLNSNGREILLDAALAGEGIGRFNVFSTGPQLKSGQLVPALLDWQVLGGPPINLLYRPNQRRTPRVRLFIDFVTVLLREMEIEIDAGAASRTAERPRWHRRGYGRASVSLRSKW